MRASIEALAEWGYDVANLGYRSGAPGLDDATAAFELLRRRLGPGEPLCLYGTSAGAQLALVVAARRGADVDCVVDLLGPPDLEDFGSRPRSTEGEQQALAAFGAGDLAALSPLRLASRIEAPVLVGAAACDEFIEPADQRQLAAALPRGELAVIAAGDDIDLEHCEVDEKSFGRFQAATRSFLDAVAPAPEVADPAPEDGDSGLPLPAIIGALVAVAGAALLVRALRR